MSKEGKKFYEKTEEGGMQFSTTRRIGDVRIPNYVYDMWMPLLGATAIGVYATYCRLERKGAVKKITLQKLANACRISKHTLATVNEKLVRCGFITVHTPEKAERLMHWTTKIVVHEAPQEIAKEIIEELKPKRGYDLLSPWLEKDASAPPAVLPCTAKAVPPCTAKIEALDSAALENCSDDEIPGEKVVPDEEFPTDSNVPPLGEEDSPKEPQPSIRTFTDPLSMAAEVARRRGNVPDWAVLGPEGIDPFYEILLAFCELTSQLPPTNPEKGKDWLSQLALVADKVETTSIGELKKAIIGLGKDESSDFYLRKNIWRTPYAASFIEALDNFVRRLPTIPNLDNFNFSGANQGRR